MKQRQKILIVDDRIENLIVLEEVLSNLDVEIFRATSGNEALSLALKHDFAVALLDVMMPEMDGYELAELLRGDAKTQVMPIVFLTASYYDEKHMFMGYEAGGVDYIMKPYAPDVLLSKVKIFLELNKHRKHLEELVAHRTKRLSHISEVLRAIRDVNQLIVKEKNVHALIQKSCDLLVGSRGMEGAWIILTDEDQDDIIEAHKGFVESVFSDFVEVFRNHNLPHCCRLAREKKRVIAARNFSEGCSTCPLKEFYSTKGVLISELVHKDQSYGFISVTLPPEYIEDAEEISLFDEITGDIAFALHGIKTEKKRHELNALFRQSFEMASIGKTLIDPDRCMKLVNRALADLLEYPREELENLCLDDIVHPDDLSENNEHIRCLLAGERLKCRMEERLVRKDKQVIWADVNMALMRNRAGEPLFLITHVLDITDRKRTDEALRQSHKIINLSPAVAFLWKNDEGWPVEYVSDNVVELFGYSAEEFINGEVSYGKIIYPDDLDRVGKEVDDYSKKDGTENFVHKPYRIITKDGDVRWVDDRTTILRNKDGIITHYQGVVLDITERKAAESALEKSEGQLATAVEMARLGPWEYEVANDLFTFNDYFYKIFRTTADRVGGYTMSSAEYAGRFVHPDDRDMVSEEVRKAIEAENLNFSRQFEHRMLFEDGSVGHISVRFFVAKDENGKTVRTYGVNQDITDRIRAEEERTTLENQLRHQQKLESIGTLASGVAHEINNPLTGILNFAELIKEKFQTNTEKIPGYADKIIDESKRVAGIVRNLLAFARQEKEHHSPAHISDIIESSLSLIGAVLRKDQIIVEKELPEEMPTIKCRSQQIQQVIMNLITNARDALNEKYHDYNDDKILRIAADAITREGESWVRVTVEDHGNGIKPEIVNRIFDPFFTTKSRDSGTGLGLSVSHGIITEHRGEITVDSKDGEYTRFNIFLRVDNGWTNNHIEG